MTYFICVKNWLTGFERQNSCVVFQSNQPKLLQTSSLNSNLMFRLAVCIIFDLADFFFFPSDKNRFLLSYFYVAETSVTNGHFFYKRYEAGVLTSEPHANRWIYFTGRYMKSESVVYGWAYLSLLYCHILTLKESGIFQA